MRFLLKYLYAACILSTGLSAQTLTDSLFIRKIYDEALVNGKAYQNLNYLCKQIGPRLSGSVQAPKAVD